MSETTGTEVILFVEIVRCQRCKAELVDLIDSPSDAVGPLMTKRRMPLTGEYERDRYANWQNSYLREGEDIICRDCLHADPIYKWSR